MNKNKVTVYKKLIQVIQIFGVIFFVALIKLVLYLKDKLLELNPLDQSRKLKKQWKQLNRQVINLDQQGALTEGIAVAEQALELACYLWGKTIPILPPVVITWQNSTEVKDATVKPNPCI